MTVKPSKVVTTGLRQKCLTGEVLGGGEEEDCSGEIALWHIFLNLFKCSIFERIWVKVQTFVCGSDRRRDLIAVAILGDEQ